MRQVKSVCNDDWFIKQTSIYLPPSSSLFDDNSNPIKIGDKQDENTENGLPRRRVLHDDRRRDDSAK